MAAKKPLRHTIPVSGTVIEVLKKEVETKKGEKKMLFRTIIRPSYSEALFDEDKIEENDLWLDFFGEENRPKDSKGKALEAGAKLQDYLLDITGRGYQSNGRNYAELRIYPSGQKSVSDDDSWSKV